MNRRNFLQLIAASLSLLLFRKTVAVENTSARPKDDAIAPLCACVVAGFQYYQGPRLVRKIRNGQKLVLRREPNNPYDERAIAVHQATGEKLGFIPRRINEIPSSLMNNGRALTAVVREVNPKVPPWEAVVIEIGLMG